MLNCEVKETVKRIMKRIYRELRLRFMSLGISNIPARKGRQEPSKIFTNVVITTTNVGEASLKLFIGLEILLIAIRS